MHVRKHGKALTEKQKVFGYKQFGFVIWAFFGYEIVTSKLKSAERREHTMILVIKTGKKNAAKGLCIDQKSYFLLSELLSRFRLSGTAS